MRTQSVIKASMYVGGIVLIILVLGLSLTSQHLYAPTSQDLVLRANLSVSDRLEELREWPPIPDNPLYPVRMIGDQIQILFTSEDQKPMVKLELASERLTSAKILLSHKRTSLALTTLTKSTKYVLSAAGDAGQLSPQSSSQIRGEVRNSITIQIQELSRLKPLFSDEQKPIVDRLLSELTSLRESFL